MAENIMEGVFINIPTHIITDILARLPPKSVIRCRCVCKAWLKLISQAEFVNEHLSKSPICLIVHKLSPDSASFSLVEVVDETDHHGVRPITGTDREITRNRVNIHSHMTMIGSIDGLVCINECSHQYYDSIHVFNPIMGEFITLQTPGGEQKFTNYAEYGFGISSGKYLVVRIYQETPNLENSTCHVYTIGGGIWKSIGHAPYHLCGRHGSLFFNCSLHWLFYDKDGHEQICCTDLEKELFKPFSSVPDQLCQKEYGYVTLNVYEGCLSVCHNSSDLDIVIWVMKEYGVKNSWSKEVVISKYTIDKVFPNYYYLVDIFKVFKDDEMLLSWKVNGKIFSYHPQRKTMQDVTMNLSTTLNHSSIEAIDYVPSDCLTQEPG